MNENWQRWIFSSVAKHFADLFADKELDYFVEGAPRKTDKLEDWAEIRMTGPNWKGGTALEWIADPVEISIMILSKLNQKNNYRFHANIGVATKAFSKSIPVFKLGDGPEDTQEYLTCLQLKAKDREPIKVAVFGQVTPDTQLLRATIDGDYFGNFSEDES